VHPSNRTINPYYHGFEAYNYIVLLMGLGYPVGHSKGTLALKDPSAARDFFHEVRSEGARLASELPSQYDYLSGAFGSALRSESGRVLSAT
jgi:tryptophan 6-halogenase